MRPVDDAILETWGEHNDFEDGGFEYVAFLIGCDVQDMEDDSWDEDECIEELADVCINARRMMLEHGYDPDTVISERLDNHKSKGTETLVEKYQQKFEEPAYSDPDETGLRSGGGGFLSKLLGLR